MTASVPGSTVYSVQRHEDHVEVCVKGQPCESFDQVVIATHSDQALRLLADPTREEREVLGGIAYQPNEAVLHTDVSLMPRRKAAWASWNYHLLDEPAGATALTYDMNRLQTLGCDRQFCVTLNLTDRIDPKKIIEVIQYEHPVFTPDAVVSQDRWAEISGADRIHYCGAYWRNGFHEDGAFTGLRAARAVEAAMPPETRRPMARAAR